MTSRERVQRTLTFSKPDRVPRQLWALPGVVRNRRAEYEALCRRFAVDFAGPRYRYGESNRTKGTQAALGKYTDAWGSVWSVLQDGVVGEVKEPPLADWSALETYKLPWELLREADMSEVDASCRESDRFVLAGGETRPFERMQFLRGSENLFYDFAYGVKEAYRLRDMLHDFFVEEMRMWANTAVDGVGFMDDWGSQKALLVNPTFWREFFKPLYRDYCDILHEKGKFVFFHSDGNIEAIYGDLIEIGVDAINSQLFCMDIERLGEKYKGRVTFNGEIDRQYVLPFGTVDEVRAAVQRVKKALWSADGGVIAECEWGINDPMENIAAVYEEWDGGQGPQRVEQ